MVRDVGGEGRNNGRRQPRSWLMVSIKSPREDRQKHLLITHSLQSITQRAVGRNEDHNRCNSDLKGLILSRQ